ncbi:MAG: hypothetical protein CSA19_01145 [Deltaproteobacteria bacterium]|nr:MAG: hypothetical protein CSA19_01145 [Deltaproteobacteria bacterium]
MIAQTANIRKFLAKMDTLEQGIADGKPNLGLVWGDYGRGKTTALTHFVSMHTNAIYLRAKARWSATWMLDDLLDALNLDLGGKTREKYASLAHFLTLHPHIIIIDEVNLILNSPSLLEMVRDLHDLSNNNPFVLCGTDDVQTRLKRYGSLYDRFRIYMGFEAVSADDVALFAKDAPIKLEQDALSFIAKKSTSIRGAQLLLERLFSKAKANAFKTLSLADIKKLER